MNPDPALHLRSNAGVLRGDSIGLFAITGCDAEDYLHRQLSNEIRNLKPGEGAPTCFLNREGRVLLHFILWKLDDSYLAVVPEDQRKNFVPEMERLVFTEEVSFRDLSPEYSSLLLCGPKSPAVLNRFSKQELPEPSDYGGFQVNLDDLALQVLPLPWLGVPVLQVVVPSTFKDELRDKLGECGAELAEWRGFHVMRIEKGTAWPGFEIDATQIPFECGLEDSINLSKGCYVGQEVLARMHNLGKPPRQLRGLLFAEGAKDSIGRGDPVLVEGTEIGKISSVDYSKSIQATVALSSIRRKFTQAGTIISVKEWEGEVRDLPISGT